MHRSDAEAGESPLFEKNEESSASGMTLTAVVEELMGDFRKLRIKREQEVEESVAAFKQGREELKKELEDVVAR